MFTKSFFKFLAGFLAIIALGVFGAVFSDRYFTAHSGMFANPQPEAGQ